MTRENLENLQRVVRAVRRQGPSFYTNLPFHNWEHILQVAGYARGFVKRCRQYGVKIDADTLLLAVYLHDAFFAIPPGTFVNPSTDRLMMSREELAAVFAKNYLEKLGVPKPMAEKVAKMIMATRYDIDPKTPEEMLLRAADLANLAGPYRQFSRNWDNLRAEAELITGQSISRRDFALRQAAFLPLYLWLDIRLTPDYYNPDGASHFHAAAISNIIRRVRTDCQPSSCRVVAEVGPGQTPVVLQERFQGPDTVYIGVDNSPGMFLPTLKLVQTRKGLGERIGPTYLIPGDAAHLPLPKGQVDVLVFRNSAELLHPAQIMRVLRPGPQTMVLVIENYAPEGPPNSPYGSQERIKRICRVLEERVGLKTSVKQQISGEFEICGRWPRRVNPR